MCAITNQVSTGYGLLNEACKITEKVIDELHVSGSGKKPRTYRKKARKQYLQIARAKKRTAKKVRKAIGQQLSYIKRNLKTIENLPVKTDILSNQLKTKLETVKSYTSSKSTCMIIITINIC